MKVAPLVSSRRFWCVRCGTITEKTGGPSCLCKHLGQEPYLFPLGVEIHGNVDLGENVSICEPADINGTGSSITIGDGADIAAFVTINCADSHLRCLELSDEIDRRPIVIEDHVFIGQGSTVLGGCYIGHHTTIGAGIVLAKGTRVKPYSLVAQGGHGSYIIEHGHYGLRT